MQQKINRRTKVNKAPMFIILAMILIVILIIVALFINFMKDNEKSQSRTPLTQTNTSSASSQTSSQTSSQASSQVSSQTPVSSQSVAVKTVKVDTVVPQTVPVDDEYFKDAIFIGDSISKGLKFYGVIPDSNVIADQNVGLDQIYRDKDVYYISAKQKTTLWNAIQNKMPNPKKIYVLLGSNGIPGYENDKHIEFYIDLVDKLKQKFPEAIIYIESITPITKNSQYIRPTFNTTKINDFNEKILKMAKDKSVYFLNIQEILKDKNGYLKAEYAATDGMHMKKEGHAAVYNYFKNHTADKDGNAKVIDKDANKGE